MPEPWTTLMGILLVGIAFVVLPFVTDAFFRYRPERVLVCPDAQRIARVKLDAMRAAMTAFPGPPTLHVERCSLWPYRGGCAQRCTRNAF